MLRAVLIAVSLLVFYSPMVSASGPANIQEINVDQLQAAFNAARDSTRVISLLSPT